ncbi:MAG: sigM 2 [Acidobacteria bacterium]|nr:sigM 2 [Acidobacteriota bacterium]
MTVSEVDTLARAMAVPAAAALDEDAFRAFYERTARGLWAYLSRTSGSAEAADDLLQESYLRLLRCGVAFESEDHRRHYLFRIATNLALDRRRRPATLPLPEHEIAPPAAGPGDPAGLLALRADVRRALGRMKPRERAMLWLAYAEGSSHEEIGRVLGVRAAGVRVLLFRAKRRLRQLLGRGGGGRQR